MKTFDIVPAYQLSEGAQLAETVGYNAHRHSDFTYKLSYETGHTADELARSLFDPNSPEKLTQTQQAIDLSRDVGSNTVYLLGSIGTHTPQGVIHIRPEPNHDPAEEPPLNGFVEIHHLAVEQLARRSGLTQILLLKGLSAIPEDAHVSLFTPYDNIAARKLIETYGFARDQSVECEQTFTDDVTVRALRYVHQSARHVTDIIKDIHPELARLV